MSKLSVAALVISVISMAGTVGNFIFQVVKDREDKRTTITVTADLLRSGVEVEDSSFPVAISKDGRQLFGQAGVSLSSAPPNFILYRSNLTLLIECKISNLSLKKVSIERLDNYIRVAKGIGLVNAAPSEVLNDDRTKAKFPRLLEQGEQVVYRVRVGWPIDENTARAIRDRCLKRRSIPRMDLYSCVQEAEIDLNFDSDGVTPKDAGIHVQSGDGQTVTRVLRLPSVFRFDRKS